MHDNLASAQRTAVKLRPHPEMGDAEGGDERARGISPRATGMTSVQATTRGRQLQQLVGQPRQAVRFKSRTAIRSPSPTARTSA
jgi:hypothetical protein